MIPAGYLAKRIEVKPEWLRAPKVAEIHSVSGCVSEDFADYIQHWCHNGYWLFDSPHSITALADRNNINLAGCALFYYEVYERQFNESNGWEGFHPESGLSLNVSPPDSAALEGYDVVSFIAQSNPECSPLSCNGLANHIDTNPYCLLESLNEAILLLEDGKFVGCERGPYRIMSIHKVEWP